MLQKSYYPLENKALHRNGDLFAFIKQYSLKWLIKYLVCARYFMGCTYINHFFLPIKPCFIVELVMMRFFIKFNTR